MESVTSRNRLTKYQKTNLLTVFLLGDGTTSSASECLFFHKYGLLDPGCRTKLEVLAAFAVGALEADNIIHHNDLSNSLGGMTLIVVVAFLFWFVFEEDVRCAPGQRDVVFGRKELGIPFIEFKKDTAGLVHGVKNDLNLVDS